MQGGKELLFWKQRATQVELSSSQWPSAGPLPRAVGTTTQGSGQAGGQFLQPPQSWAERSGIFIGNFQVRALIFLLVYYLGGQGGEVMVFYQGASKLL